MKTRLEDLIKTLKKLRDPDGCSWNKEQTHETLIPYLLEETYEVIEAIEKKWKSPIIPNYQSFYDYINKGGYQKLKEVKDRKDIWYDNIIKADLRGLGGAGFRTAKKWKLVSNEKGPRYLAVNGDEGEPGTFKDKYYLEKEPHMFLEGMLMAATSINAEKCFIYIRDEYPAVLSLIHISEPTRRS